MPDPRHVAIVMDGNGRWAAARGLPRTAGHAAGEEALFDVVHGALGLGIEWLTVFTFSTENWSRPDEEVGFLMGFKEDLLTRRRDELHELGVRVLFLGDRHDPRVSDRLRTRIREAEELTSGNTNMTMVFAFNYGARLEIVDAARRLAADVASGEIAVDDIDEQALASRFEIPEMPDPDLVIRTSGEHRISNFLLWQSAYSEFIFPDTLWPDFRTPDLEEAVEEYRGRERRYGGVGT
ncbi:MAG TPA: polyprenyl diphosphate synthase [Acidimicrobiia bacterium]|nr:polyprenyl diphosphate synthase [Acidimicrobiia bacterium]